MHGGDRAEGIADESVRHAITKLSHVHFPATELSRERLLRLGEDPAQVYLTYTKPIGPNKSTLALARGTWDGRALTGLRDIFASPGLKVAEWPEKAQAVLPEADLVVRIEASAEGEISLSDTLPTPAVASRQREASVPDGQADTPPASSASSPPNSLISPPSPSPA